MRKRTVITLLSVVLLCLCASAKTITTDGKAVKRLLFDREQVTIVYADGSQEQIADTDVLELKTDDASAIYDIKVDNNTKTDGIYDLQGHKMNKANLTSGFYIERRNGKAVKIIHK